MSDRKLRPSEAIALVEHAMKCGRPTFLWGSPGIGKSDIVASIGKKQKRPVIDIRLLLMAPEDLRGIPYYNPTENTMRWAAPNELPKKGDVSMENAIVFFDEMNSAPPSVQGAAYQLILNRRIGEYELPAGVSMVAAGNLETDKGVTNRMPTPLANRFVHLFLTHNFEDWQRWAISAGVHSDVVGFLSHSKQHLFNFDPKSPHKAFATPRTWQFASDLLADDLPEHLMSALIAGTVGEGVAVEFMAHRKVAAKLPLPEDVFSGKAKTMNGIKDISAKYSMAVALAYHMQTHMKTLNKSDEQLQKDADWHKMIDMFFRFTLDNFEHEMVVLGAKIILRDFSLPMDPDLLKNFSEFHQKVGKFILDDE